MSDGIGGNTDWSLTKRIFFRFAVAFFLLINFPAPLDLIPSKWFTHVVTVMTDAPVRAAARLLHVSVDIRPNGSGDTTYNWVNLLCAAVAAVVITIIWSILDRRRRSYDKGW